MKRRLIVFVSLAVIGLFTGSLTAQFILPYNNDFESGEGFANGQTSFTPPLVSSATGVEVTNLEALSGTQSILLSSSNSSLLFGSFSSSSSIVFVDFYVLPSLGVLDELPLLALSGNSVQSGFIYDSSQSEGRVVVFDMSAPFGSQWVDVNFPFDANAEAGNEWLRMTYRINYSLKTWDLFVNNVMVALDLGFVDPTVSAFSEFRISNSGAVDSYLDRIFIETGNPLFFDQDEDGIPDSEDAIPGIYSRYDDPDRDSLSNIEEFLHDTDANDPDSDGDILHDGMEIHRGADPNTQDSYSLSSLPFFEFFSYPAGPFSFENNWMSSGNLTLSVDNQQRLQIDTGSTQGELSHFADGRLTDLLWVSFDLKTDSLNTSTDPILSEDTTAGFYFNSEGLLRVFDGSIAPFGEWQTLSNTPIDFTATQRLVLNLDYDKRTWSIYLNELREAKDLGFAHAAPYYTRFGLTQFPQSQSFLDTFVIETFEPTMLDNDKDGLVNNFERSFGFDLEDPDQNGNGILDAEDDFDGDDWTHREEFVFNLDPTVPDVRTLPFVEDFEGYNAGDLIYTLNNWRVKGDTTLAVVQSAMVNQGTQALEILPDASSIETTFSNRIEGAGFEKVEVDFKIKAEGYPLNVVPALDDDTTAGFYFTEDGKLQAYDGTNAIWMTIATGIDLTQWQHITLRLDYAQRTWSLAQGGVWLAWDFGFAHYIEKFRRFSVRHSGEESIFIDDISIDGEPSPELTAHFALDDGSGSTEAVDVSTNGNNGTITGSVEWPGGVSGRSIRIDSGADGFFFSNSSHQVLPDEGTDGFSISLWLKAETLEPPVANRTMTLMLNESYQQSGFRFAVTAGPYGDRTILFWTGESGGTTTLNSQTQIKTNEWYHVVVTHDGNLARMYIDGNEETVDLTASIVVNTNNIRVGGAIGGHGYFPGLIDDVQFHQGALNATTIKTMYETIVTQSTDGDSLLDIWELEVFDSLDEDDDGNPDGDRWTNLEEFQNGTDPQEYDGVPTYIIAYEAGQFHFFSHSLELLDSFNAPAGLGNSGRITADPRGGFWLAYPSGGELTVRYYEDEATYTDFISDIDSEAILAVRWSEQELLLVNRQNGENYLVVYDLMENEWTENHKLLHSSGFPTNITTTPWIFGIERLKSTGTIWIEHVVSTAAFRLDSENPGHWVTNLSYPQTGYGNAIETIAFSDSQLASIDKNGNGGIRIWNPDALNDPTQTYNYIRPITPNITGFTGLHLLADGRFLATSNQAPDTIVEIATDLTVTEINVGVNIVHTNDTGNMVEVHDLFLNGDGDELPDDWEQRIVDADPSDGIDTIEDVLAGDDFELDGLDNATELLLGTDPTLWDTDDDGASDGTEVVQGTDPLDPDTDDDRMHDGYEIFNALNPLDPSDALLDKDGDRFPNVFEFMNGMSEPDNPASIPLINRVVDPVNTPLTYSTIQSAFESAQSYDIIYVKNGIYEEAIGPISGNSDYELLLIGELAGDVLPTIRCPIDGPAITTNSLNSILVVDGFVIRQGEGVSGAAIEVQADIQAIPPFPVSDLIFKNCFITGNDEGVLPNGAFKITFEHCTLFNNTASAANIVSSNGELNIINSILWNPQAAQEVLLIGGNATVSDSIIRNGALGGIAEDPLITPQGYLTHLSPAVDGVTGSLVNAFYDIQGELRMFGGTPDIGADEFIDNDGDHLPNWWEFLYSFDPNDAFSADSLNSIEDGNYDSDLDGSSNASEYLRNGNPLVFEDGLLGNIRSYWPLNAGVGDNVMNYGNVPNEGTLVNGVAWVTGSFDDTAALSFDEIDDRVEMGSPVDGSLDYDTDNFSISVWVRYSDTYARIISKGHYGWDEGYFVGTAENGELVAGIGTSVHTPSEGLLFKTTSSFNDANWHHVVAVFDHDAKRASLYVDGMAQTLVPMHGGGGQSLGTRFDFSSLNHLSATNPGKDFFLGAHYHYDVYGGLLDDVKMIDLALTEQEVQSLYANDFDADGLPDSWEYQILVLGVSDQDGDQDVDVWDVLPEGDYDNDGRSNFLEFSEGTNPIDFYDGVPPVINVLSANPITGGTDEFVELRVQVTSDGTTLLPNAPVTFSTAEARLSTTNDGIGLVSDLAVSDMSGVVTVYFQQPSSNDTSTSIEVAAGLASTTIIAQTSVALADPIAHWTFEDALDPGEDISGNNHDLTVVESIRFEPGILGLGAMRFDGVNDVLEDDDAETYLNGLSELTLSLWVKSEIMQADSGIVAGKDPDGSDSALSLRYAQTGAFGGSANIIRLGLSTTGGDLFLESSADVQTTQWQHIAFTWKSSEQLALYVNGQLSTTTFNSVAVAGTVSGLTKLLLGKSTFGGNSWQGLIDDVRIFDQALDANAVQLIYSESAGDPLIAHWKFDGNTDDASSYEHSVALKNGAQYQDEAVQETHALDLSGPYGWVDLAVSDDADFLTKAASERTVSLWMKPFSFAGTQVIYDEGGYSSGLGIRIFNGDLEVKVNHPLGDLVATVTLPYVNVWQHLGVTWNEGTLKVFLDGVEVDSQLTALFNEIPLHVDKAGIGASNQSSVFNAESGPIDFFHGYVDDVRIYNRVLSAAKMQSFYQVDVDGNNILDHWEATHFGFVGIDPNGNPDGDLAGNPLLPYTNLDEFNEGNDPNVFEYFFVPTLEVTGEQQSAPENEFVANPIVVTVKTPGGVEVPKARVDFVMLTSGPGNTGLAAVESGTTPDTTTIVEDTLTLYTNNLGQAVLTHPIGDTESVDTYFRQPGAAAFTSEIEAIAGSTVRIISAFTPNALLAHWQLDESSGTVATDISGNANNADVLGVTDTASWNDGIFYGGLAFDGIDDVLSASSSVIPSSGDSFSLAFWMKADTYAAVPQTYALMSHGDGTSDGFNISIDGMTPGAEGVQATVVLSDSVLSIRSPAIIETNRWYHIALTFEDNGAGADNNVVLTVNGLETVGVGSGSFVPGAGGLSIASRVGESFFKGSMEDIRIYSKLLSSQEMLDLFHADIDNGAITPNGLPDWWEATHFSAVGIDPVDNPDSDYYINKDEYANGTDPNVFNGFPKYLVSFAPVLSGSGDTSKFHLIDFNPSFDFKLVGSYDAPNEVWIEKDPGGAFWTVSTATSGVNDYQLRLTRYLNFESTEVFDSSLLVDADGILGIELAGDQLFILYRRNAQTYVVGFNISLNTFEEPFPLYDESGNPDSFDPNSPANANRYGGIAYLKSTGELWIQHSQTIVSAYRPGNEQPERRVRFIDFSLDPNDPNNTDLLASLTPTQLLSEIQLDAPRGLSAFSDEQLAIINATANGKILIWNPDDLDPVNGETFIFVDPVSPAIENLAHLELLSDGRWIAWSNTDAHRFVEVENDGSISRDFYFNTAIVSGSHGLVQIADLAADSDLDQLPDIWEAEQTGGGSNDLDPDVDDDGDTNSNLDEYIGGSDPIDFYHQPPTIPGEDPLVIVPTVEIVTGNGPSGTEGQSGDPDTYLTIPYLIKVTHIGLPIKGAPITFTTAGSYQGLDLVNTGSDPPSGNHLMNRVTLFTDVNGEARLDINGFSKELYVKLPNVDGRSTLISAEGGGSRVTFVAQTTGVPPNSDLPVLAFVTPAYGSEMIIPQGQNAIALTFQISATDLNGIAQIELFKIDSLDASDSIFSLGFASLDGSAPDPDTYTFTWNAATPGSYTIIAKATDGNAGNPGISAVSTHVVVEQRVDLFLVNEALGHVMGGIAVDLSEDGNSYRSLPVMRTPRWEGRISEVTIDSIKVTEFGGPPQWALNEFAFDPNQQQTDTFEAVIMNGPLAGARLPIVTNGSITNTSDTLMVDFADYDYTQLVEGTRLQIVPAWTLATAFTELNSEETIVTSQDSTNRRTEILVPDRAAVGTGQLPVATYIKKSDDGLWYDVSNLTTSVDHDTLLLSNHFVVNQKAGDSTVWMPVGDLVETPTAQPLVTDSVVEQDNPVSYVRLAPMNLDEAGLLSGAAFRSSLFDDTLQTPLDRLQDLTTGDTYYYFNGDWRKEGAPATDSFGNVEVLKPAHGYLIIRSPSNAVAKDIWTQWPNSK